MRLENFRSTFISERIKDFFPVKNRNCNVQYVSFVNEVNQIRKFDDRKDILCKTKQHFSHGQHTLSMVYEINIHKWKYLISVSVLIYPFFVNQFYTKNKNLYCTKLNLR